MNQLEKYLVTVLGLTQNTSLHRFYLGLFGQSTNFQKFIRNRTMIGSCIRYGAVRCGFSNRKTNRKIIVVLWVHKEFGAKEKIFLNQG